MDRVFYKAADSHDRHARSKSAPSRDEPVAKDETQASPDEIERILKAWEDKDYFEMLQLPAPTADAIGQAVWDCTNADISRAYRKLSILVHPDKNPGEKARQAFEALNQAHRLLKDPNKLETALKAAAEKAVELQKSREARATASERIQINSERLGKAKELQEKQGKDFHDRIVQQMKARQAMAKKRRAGGSRYRREEGGSSGDEERDSPQKKEQGGGGDDLDGEIAPIVQRKKKKPVFI